MSKITQDHIDAILDEADGAEFPEIRATGKAVALPKGVSFSGFKASWPTKIRPVVMAVINILGLFRLGSYATYVAQAVAFIDLVIGGQMPVE